MVCDTSVVPAGQFADTGTTATALQVQVLWPGMVTPVNPDAHPMEDVALDGLNTFVELTEGLL